MAINDIVQTIAEARVDARSLSEFVFKPAGFKVTRRLAPTVDTLQFYINRFNSLNGEFSSSVSVALSSLNNSVSEADGKVAYIETTVQDAINNTAVEGGVLADTFVTATANAVGSIARNQRDKNSDIISVKDFGAKGDGVTDDTDAFFSAISTGRKVYFPEGSYFIKMKGHNNLGRDIVIEGSNAEIILGHADMPHVVDISDCDVVRVSGIKFIGEYPSSIYRMFSCGSTASVGDFAVTNCEFVGRVALLRAEGSTTQLNSESPYGFKRIEYSNNISTDCYTIHISLTDFPVHQIFIINNKVHNFASSFIYLGLTNLSPNEQENHAIGDAVIKHNIITGDDDFSRAVTSGTYYCFFLGEGQSAVVEDNYFSGMIANSSGVSLYPVYLNYFDVLYTRNTYKNNGNFSLGTTGGWLIMCKSDSLPEVTTQKTITNNTFIIEDSWIKRLGKDSCSCRLYDTGVTNGGKVLISGNTFHLNTLGNQLVMPAESFNFTNNTIIAKEVAGYPVVSTASPQSSAGTTTATITGNYLDILNAGGLAVFFRGSVNSSHKSKYVDVSDNRLVTSRPLTGFRGFSLAEDINASEVSICRNSLTGGMWRNYANISTDKLSAFGNSSLNSSSVLSAVFSSTPLLNSMYIDDVIRGSINTFVLPVMPTLDMSVGDVITALVEVTIDSSNGGNKFQATYFVDKTDDGLFVNFTDSSGSREVRAKLGTGEETYTKLKVKASGDGSNNIGFSFSNPTSLAVVFNLTGKPSGFSSINYKLYTYSANI